MLFGNRYSTCRCNTWFWNDDMRLQEAFRVIPIHDCASCRFWSDGLFTKTVGLGWVSEFHS